jgi:hypothetical protein
MALDKILQKIQTNIKELAPQLEVFVEHTIQPTVEDAEKLTAHLHTLLENIAVYRHYRSQHEISPSYAIHAAVSEVEVKDAPKQRPEVNKTETVAPPHPAVKPLAISINDKFRFINELFAQNSSEYAIAAQQFGTLRTWNECEIYLNSLKSLYEWDDNKEIVRRLYTIVRKRFE